MALTLNNEPANPILLLRTAPAIYNAAQVAMRYRQRMVQLVPRILSPLEMRTRTLSCCSNVGRNRLFFEGIDFYAPLARARFEELCQGPFHSTFKSSVLAGQLAIRASSGSFPTSSTALEPNKSINPDKAASYGTAAWAVLSGHTSERLKRRESCLVTRLKDTQEFLLLDVAPAVAGYY